MSGGFGIEKSIKLNPTNEDVSRKRAASTTRGNTRSMSITRFTIFVLPFSLSVITYASLELRSFEQMDFPRMPSFDENSCRS